MVRLYVKIDRTSAVMRTSIHERLNGSCTASILLESESEIHQMEPDIHEIEPDLQSGRIIEVKMKYIRHLSSKPSVKDTVILHALGPHMGFIDPFRKLLTMSIKNKLRGGNEIVYRQTLENTFLKAIC